MASIVVSGYMVRFPLAGMMLAFFQHIAGLHRLGHDIFYFEESGWSGSCYDPHLQTHGDDPTAGIAAVRRLFRDAAMDIPICYVDRATGKASGIDWEQAQQLLREADLLLNVGGVCWLPEFLLCRRRALIDMDPFFTQIGKFGVEGIEHYHVRFSYGVNIGKPGCGIPPDGYRWVPTVPPVVPELWKNLPVIVSAGQPAPFTTVANWSAYGVVSYQDEEYGQKDREFVRVRALPERVEQRLEIALSGASEEVCRNFKDAGWRIIDAGQVTASVSAYQQYISSSRGEFSVAKHAYVKSRSGWFSDRSVCFLAAGRPVVLQDTGFSDWLPVGRGVLSFSSMEEAAHCLAAVDADYATHCEAASEIAEEFFDYRRVLPPLLTEAIA